MQSADPSDVATLSIATGGPPQSNPSRIMPRLYGVELLRFGAAFAVLLAHYNGFYHYGLQTENFSIFEQPLFTLFRPFYLYGTRAVEVFWCVSGFIFFHQYARAINQHKITIGRFAWLRFTRLYPLHLFTLLAVGILQYAYHCANGSFFVIELNNLKHFILHLLLASHWGLQDGFSFNAPVWSVSLEILIYMFFFAVTWWIRPNVYTTVSCLVACAGLNRALGYEGVFIRCLFYFYSGGLACIAYQWLSVRSPVLRIGFGITGSLAVAWCWQRFQATSNLDLWVLNIATPLALVISALGSSLIRGSMARFIEGLGNLTYATYLGHFPLQLFTMLVLGLVDAPHTWASSPWFLITYLVIIFSLARVVYLKFELPAQVYLRRNYFHPTLERPLIRA